MTYRLFRCSGLTVFVSAVALAQTGEPSPKFEVASVKPAAPVTPGPRPPSLSGGPGTGDPTRYTASNRSVKSLLAEAYGMPYDRISGPRMIEDGGFDVVAKVPAGATREEFRVMLRNLLEERFQLKLHHENKQVPVYVLVVGAKGPKLQKTKYDVAGGGPNPAPRSMLALGRAVFPASPVSATLGLLTSELGRPVLDETGLKDRYDFTLLYTPMDYKPSGPDAPADLGPGILGAVETLGLKLVPAKRAVEYLVVDYCAKSPTGN